jgi:hypothetical protein
LRNARVLALVLAMSLLAATSRAQAAPDRAQCLTSVDDGQKKRDEGKWTEARALFLVCADRSCPSAVTTQCIQWLEELAREQPSILFRIRDQGGRDALEATLYVDGSTEGVRLGTTAIAVDPGVHKVRVVLRDGSVKEESFLLHKGDRDRIVEVSFPRAPAEVSTTPLNASAPLPKVSAKPFHVPALAWVSGGTFALGGAFTAVFAVLAKNQESALRETGCAPGCDPSARSSINTKVTLANVSLVTGLVGLGSAFLFTLIANLGSSPSSTTPRKTGTLRSLQLEPKEVDLRW